MTHTPEALSHKKHFIEKWYLINISIGLILGGSNVILLPQLIAHNLYDGLIYVGFLMGILSGGGLLGPWWGKYSQKYHIEREVVLFSLLIIVISEALLPLSSKLWVWFLLTTLQGLVVPGVMTNLGLFIVLRHPQIEWDKRTNNMWLFYSIGTVIGLTGASFFPGEHAKWGIWVSDILIIISTLWAFFTLPSLRKIILPKKQIMQQNSLPKNKTSWTHVYVFSAFGLTIFSWFFVNLGSNVLFFDYPLVMNSIYHVPPNISGIIIGVSALIALVWYPLIGKWSEWYGASQVFYWSVLMRLIAFAGLTVIVLNWLPVIWVIITASFMVFVYRQTWPFMLTGSTILAAKLSGAYKGIALGIFTATLGLSGLLAGVIGSFTTMQWGLKAMSLVSFILIMIGYIGIIFLKTLAKPYLQKDIDEIRAQKQQGI